jgi:hypothetical protein
MLDVVATTNDEEQRLHVEIQRYYANIYKQVQLNLAAVGVPHE